MSGIAGIVNLDDQPVDGKLLRNLTESLRFRGPDNLSTYAKQNVGFGHALLNTTRHLTGHQIVSLDNNLWITAHARIDDRLTLVTKLSQLFPYLNDSDDLPTDAQLVLLSYRAWGEDCLQYLIGDFSFAIWDAERRQLFCARDQMGVGQFFYALKGRSLIFSNTLNCIRLHPAVSPQLNDVAIGDFLLFGVNQDPSTTSFADIQRLPRAHALVVTQKELRTVEYWKPSLGNIRFNSDREYVDRFKELLNLAVSDRVHSNKVGVAMSGGLDSSMVAATAVRNLKATPTPCRAYTVVYDSVFRDDERYYAGEVAKSLEIPIEFLEGASINQETSLRTCGYAPEPFDVEPFYVVSDKLLQRIATSSRVALTGWDGDAFMMESPKHLFYELWRTRRIVELSEELFRYVHSQRKPPPLGVRTWLQRRSTRRLSSRYPVWLDDEFERRLKLRDRWREITDAEPLRNPTRPYALKTLNSPDWDTLFARYDPGSSSLPLEVRHPLIDLRLVEYLLALPITPWMIGKHLLREAARGVLPKPVQQRRKTTLNGDPGMQLRYSTKARDIDSFPPTLEVLNYVKRDAVPLLATESDRYRLWINARPFSLNQWFRNSFKLDHAPSSEHPDDRQSKHFRALATQIETTVHDPHVGDLRSYT